MNFRYKGFIIEISPIDDLWVKPMNNQSIKVSWCLVIYMCGTLKFNEVGYMCGHKVRRFMRVSYKVLIYRIKEGQVVFS